MFAVVIVVVRRRESVEDLGVVIVTRIALVNHRAVDVPNLANVPASRRKNAAKVKKGEANPGRNPAGLEIIVMSAKKEGRTAMNVKLTDGKVSS